MSDTKSFRYRMLVRLALVTASCPLFVMNLPYLERFLISDYCYAIRMRGLSQNRRIDNTC